MKRNLLVVALAACALGACRTQPLTTPIGSDGDVAVDLSPPPDLTTSFPDAFVPIDLSQPDLTQPPPTDFGIPPCGRTGPDPGTADPFKRAVYGFAAEWRGTATSPWVAPYTVDITFNTDGTYSAQTLDYSGVGYDVTPFYYGDSLGTNAGIYQVENLLSDGDATGRITVFTNQYDDLAQIRFNDTLTHLHFQYFHDVTYGPIVYELDCM
jgi:hypothetical protein